MNATTIRLTPEQTTALVNARQILSQIQGDLDALQKCGYDCSQFRQRKAELDAGLSAIVQYFGHGTSGII